MYFASGPVHPHQHRHCPSFKHVPWPLQLGWQGIAVWIGDIYKLYTGILSRSRLENWWVKNVADCGLLFSPCKWEHDNNSLQSVNSLPLTLPHRKIQNIPYNQGQHFPGWSQSISWSVALNHGYRRKLHTYFSPWPPRFSFVPSLTRIKDFAFIVKALRSYYSLSLFCYWIFA